jgi:hypothetical protein
MFKLHRMLASAVLCVAIAAPSFAQTSITGELVDQTCYLKDKSKNVGVGHEDCAVMCAMKGQQVALVTDAGELYLLAGDLTKDNNAVLAPHMSHRVVLTGDISEKDGKKVITVKTLKMAPPRL